MQSNRTDSRGNEWQPRGRLANKTSSCYVGVEGVCFQITAFQSGLTSRQQASLPFTPLLSAFFGLSIVKGMIILLHCSLRNNCILSAEIVIVLDSVIYITHETTTFSLNDLNCQLFYSVLVYNNHKMQNNRNTPVIDMAFRLQPFSGLMLLRLVEVAMTSAWRELYT
jgi:hypothetical protein